MATVKTIESSFESMTEEQRKANLAAVGYIKSLASMTNTDIHRWDILKIFGSGEGANLLTDKKAINKIFFEKLEKLVDKKSEDIASLDSIPELSAALENSFQATMDSRKSEIQYQINETMRNIESRNNQLVQLMTSLNELQKQHSLITLNPEPLLEIKKEIQEVLKAGYWVNPVVHNGYLYFNTASNIRLTHKNRAAGIDCELDVGQLAVRIRLSDFYMDVIPYKNNICYDDGGRGHRLYHPHVNSNAQICWGNALQTMQNHMKTFQLGKILTLLYALLTSYNDAAPYIHLVNLRDRNKKFSRIPANLKHPDKIKTKAEPSDDPYEFDIGEEVTYELANNNNEARWDFSNDRGGNGTMARARVISIDDVRHSMTTESIEGERSTWNWPLPGHEEFAPNRPGFVARARS